MTAAQRLRLVLALGVVNVILATVALSVGISGLSTEPSTGGRPSPGIAQVSPGPTEAPGVSNPTPTATQPTSTPTVHDRADRPTTIRAVRRTHDRAVHPAHDRALRGPGRVARGAGSSSDTWPDPRRESPHADARHRTCSGSRGHAGPDAGAQARQGDRRRPGPAATVRCRPPREAGRVRPGSTNRT